MKRSESGKPLGLHKRSAEDWGNPLRARGAALPSQGVCCCGCFSLLYLVLPGMS
jgi:hypothetical protein